ncbi:hypothetical protein Q5P01_018616 [Channa striata]|uniref:Uncharacterized protein n=1 Tax=Channa striata TaxID=64152 RepID=A0AA88M568_CHASR|nr:hypothetical protein Q5P01_018616 [Channa striata]
MDVLTSWAVTNPAVARLLWVLLLVLATLLVWVFFWCCYSWNQSSSPSLERYLEGRRQKFERIELGRSHRRFRCTNRNPAVVLPDPETQVTLDILSTMEEVKDKAKRRPLVRAASEETSSDLGSISCSPSPGDTLPWNLPKHHRIKRSKSASGDVLDPAERAIIRIAVLTQYIPHPTPPPIRVSWSSSNSQVAELHTGMRHIPERGVGLLLGRLELHGKWLSLSLKSFVGLGCGSQATVRASGGCQVAEKW